MAADFAIQTFLAAVASWLNPRVHTLSGLLLAGLTFYKDRPTVGDARDMVRLAVRCSASLDEQILSVERTGVFDRKQCSSGDISMEPGFMEFDPCTEMGRLR